MSIIAWGQYSVRPTLLSVGLGVSLPGCVFQILPRIDCVIFEHFIYPLVPQLIIYKVGMSTMTLSLTSWEDDEIIYGKPLTNMPSAE